ncbi:NAD(P)-dependent oxidoreductase [Phreatobacter stygius]|uniref:NAD(P)-dependent oxidoreductase n=1 Tax=Phreatobacter stygius TaxID=1940610 RepID=A0A4D7BK77_9HYPH|nr:NAD(P)-dependent oxidoreductase [Phreatobacter stygius]QCI68147.1 NAD(P)-dependent oxidoreductase [Phreatobacter stygius]
MSKQRIGFIGVGLMGHGMAKNLVEKGFPLTVTANRNRTPVEDLVQRGATEVTTAKAVAEASDIVFICVTGAPEVDQVVNGPDGLRAGAAKGLFIVDCSTSEPTLTRRLAGELAGIGVTFLDAPLSRTPKEAFDGQLDVMAGGAEADLAHVRPAIEAFAGRIVHVGPVGAGHTMKIVNNFIAMGYAALYSEALTVAKANGVAPAAVNAVLSGGRMDCGFYQTFFKYVVGRDENAHRFSISNAHKDMRYLAAMAEATGIANPLGSAVKNYFAMAEAQGNGGKYVPMLSDEVARFNGVDLLAKG